MVSTRGTRVILIMRVVNSIQIHMNQTDTSCLVQYTMVSAEVNVIHLYTITRFLGVQDSRYEQESRSTNPSGVFHYLDVIE